MQPVDYLDPDNFRTGYDLINPEYASKQYAHGLQIGQEYDYIAISYRGVWSAGSYGIGKHVFSYETIGLHANTAELLQGFLDSGKPIWIFTWPDGEPITRTEIHTGYTVHGLMPDTPDLHLEVQPHATRLEVTQ